MTWIQYETTRTVGSLTSSTPSRVSTRPESKSTIALEKSAMPARTARRLGRGQALRKCSAPNTITGAMMMKPSARWIRNMS